jgi:hypothetical protein
MVTISQIVELLDTHSSVSSAWLANTFDISVNTSVGLLQQVKDNRDYKHIHATYLAKSIDHNNNATFAVVDEESLDDWKQQHVSGQSSVSVYSLEKVGHALTKTNIVNASMQLVEALMRNTSALENSFLSNCTGSVTLSGLMVQPVGERLLSRHNTSTSHISVAATPQPTKFGNGGSSSSSSMSTAAKTITTTTATATSVAATTSVAVKAEQAKNQAKALSFFGKTTTTTTVAPKASVPGSNNSDNAYEPLKANPTKKKAVVQDEDEEWDDGTTPLVGVKRIVPKKATLDDSDDEVAGNGLAADTNEKIEVDSKKKSKTVNVRGALDDYMEDVAIEKFREQQQQSTDSSATEKKKRTKRVLVEKVCSHCVIVFVIGFCHWF